MSNIKINTKNEFTLVVSLKIKKASSIGVKVQEKLKTKNVCCSFQIIFD